VDGGAIPSQGTTRKAAAIRTDHRSKHAVHWDGGSVRLSIVVDSTPSSSVADCSYSETERKAIWSRLSVMGDRRGCLGGERNLHFPRTGECASSPSLESFHQDDVTLGVLDSGKEKSTAVRREAGTPDGEQAGQVRNLANVLRGKLEVVQ